MTLTDQGRSLDIFVLGPWKVLLDGQAVEHFSFERVRALLCYLVIEGNISHERVALATLLWPDARPKAAMENLRQALVCLRQALKDQNQPPTFLHITPKTIRFNATSNYSLDYSAFVGLLEAIRQHPHRRLGVCSKCIDALKQVVSLYRGDFLANIAVESEVFDEWVSAKREHLYQHMSHSLTALVDHYIQRGDYDEAIMIAQRQIQLDPLCDSAHHQMIYSLAANQRRHEALAHYRRYSSVLDDELQVVPPRQTSEMCEQLRNGTWQVVPIPGSGQSLPSEITRFVGYGAELAYLGECLASHHCRIVTVSGAAGSGKTRLALKAARQERSNFRDGVFFVDLSRTAPNQLLRTIASALPTTAQLEDDVTRRLPAWLEDKELLLVLDSFDHLIEQGYWLTALLQQAPRLSIVVTSCEWLKVQGETVLTLRGLECAPPAATDPEAYPATQLFLESMRRLQPDYALSAGGDLASIATLCRLIGGLPLALELVASWSTLFPLDKLISSVSAGLEPLNSPLQHTLERTGRGIAAVFRASLQRLSPAEQQVYYRLCVFQHSFTIEAAQAIGQATPDILMLLQSKSLLHGLPRPDAESPEERLDHGGIALRYEISPLLRIFAAGMLRQQGQLTPWLQEAHFCRYYLGILREQIEQLNGPQRRNALRAIRAEIEHIERAWQWTLEEKQYGKLVHVQYQLVAYYTAEGNVARASQILDDVLTCLVQAGTQ